MTARISAAVAAAILLSAASANAQSREMYHWRSFYELASVLHIADYDGYEVLVEKYGPLVETDGWPVETWVSFAFWGVGVQGYCWFPEDDFRLDEKTGNATLDATLSFDNCAWLEGASSLRVQLTWKPDGSYHRRRHFTLLGDTNRTSSEQGWEDDWLHAAVEGTIWIDGATVSVPLEETGYTHREWGHGVIPLFLSAFQ